MLFNMKKTTTAMVWLVIMLLPIQHLRFIFFGVNVPYRELFLILFVGYYLIFELNDAKELLVNKNALSYAAVIFFVIVFSQLQARFIDFPITTIRQGAVANYPYIKSLLRILHVSLLFLFSLCIAHYARKFSLKKVINIHLISATLLSLFLIIIFFSNFIFPLNKIVLMTSSRSDERFIRMTGFFEEPSSLAFYLLTSIPFLIALLFYSFSKTKAAALLVQLFCLFLTFSRSGWLAFMVIILAAVYLFRERYLQRLITYKKQFSFLALVVIFMVTALLFSYQPARDFIYDSTLKHFTQAIDYTNTGKFWSTRLRLEAYKDAVHAFQLHPFLGVGIFNFHFYGGYYLYTGLFDNRDFYLNNAETNNFLLMVLAELGILGIIVTLFYGFLIIRYVVRVLPTVNKEGKEILLGLIMISLSVMVIFQFTSRFTHPFLWFFLGICLAFSTLYPLSAGGLGESFIRTPESLKE